MSKYFKNNSDDTATMGVAGIPGTFPTGKVLGWIESNFPHLRDQWNRSKVNEFYFAYKNLISQGSDPWPAAGVSDKLNQATGYKDALMFFSSVKKLIDEGEISPQWLMKGGSSSDPTEIVQKLSEGGLTVAKNLKWVGLLALVGVGIYFTWPWLTAARNIKKTRNKVRK